MVACLGKTLIEGVGNYLIAAGPRLGNFVIVSRLEACGQARGVKGRFQGTLATGDGERLWAFRCSGEGRSRSLLSTRDAGLLGQMHHGRQILRPGAR